jgi:hypothetical protein
VTLEELSLLGLPVPGDNFLKVTYEHAFQIQTNQIQSRKPQLPPLLDCQPSGLSAYTPGPTETIQTNSS